MDMSEGGPREESVFDPSKVYDFKLEETIDEKYLLSEKDILESVQSGKKSEIDVTITNTDRTFGTLLGAEITRNHPEGLEEDTIRIHCNGSGGQSFGAFIPKGLTIEINGDSNDYFGKGLSGGKLIIHAPKRQSMFLLKTSTSEMWPFTVLPAERPISQVWPVNDSAFVTPAQRQLLKVSVNTDVNT